ncbi:protein CEBPZOS [Nematostella vectensis]|uniref:protein CEBPZOS n=1 Tax=Nematostella vectensis TaxID=45351 RepID=UPI00138FC158|nr:protein CEBPZOS [Nematostella vectensis]
MVLGARHRWLVLRGVIVAEAVAFLTSFRVWHYMNTDQEYRRWMKDNYPSILEGFYTTAEMGGYVDVRKDDQKTWNSE